MTMEKISEAILDKVKAEADGIIAEAETAAKERMEKAREQYNNRFEQEKAKLREEAESEVFRIRAQASINVNLEILKVKNEIVQNIFSNLKNGLADIPNNDILTVNLIKEGIRAIGYDKVVVYLAPEHIDSIKNLVKNDEEIASRVQDYRETNCTGGAIVEDADGGFRIDNTFETRLNTLLPRVMPEISKELFG